MRVLIWGDLHADDWLDCSYGKRSDNTRFKDSLNVLGQLDAKMGEYNVDYSVFLGDLFHKRGMVRTEIFLPVMEKLRQIVGGLTETNDDVSNIDNKECFMLKGNHDDAYYGSNSILEVLSGWKPDIRIIEDPCVVFVKDSYTFVFLPYIKDQKDLIDNLNLVRGESNTERTIYFWHCGISNIHYFDVELPVELIPEGWNFFGHYHNFHKIKSKAYFVGSCLQNNWGDEGVDKYFILYDSEKDKITKIPIRGPRFVTIDMKSKEKNNNIVGNFVKILYGEGDNPEPLKEKYLNEGARFVKLEMKDIVLSGDVGGNINFDGTIDAKEILMNYVSKNVSKDRVEEYYDFCMRFLE